MAGDVVFGIGAAGDMFIEKAHKPTDALEALAPFSDKSQVFDGNGVPDFALGFLALHQRLVVAEQSERMLKPVHRSTGQRLWALGLQQGGGGCSSPYKRRYRPESVEIKGITGALSSLSVFICITA